jgi:hypothetical protein
MGKLTEAPSAGSKWRGIQEHAPHRLRAYDARTVEACAEVAEAEDCFGGEPPAGVLSIMDLAGPIDNARSAASVTKRSIAAAIRKLAGEGT